MISQLPVPDLLISCAIISVGAVLQAATGLGAGLIIVPLVALINIAFIPGPMIFASLALSGLMTVRGREHILFPGTPILLLGLALGSIVAAALLSRLPLDELGVLFGAFILLAVLVSVIAPKIVFNTFRLFIAGGMSGFMGTTVSIGAPILALVYQHKTGPQIRATLAYLYFLSSIGALFCLHWFGRFGLAELSYGLCLAPGFLVGYPLAGKLVTYVDAGYARPLILWLATLCALILISKRYW